MNLFASGENSGLITLFVFGVVAYAAYHAYIFFCRPEQWAEMQRRKHEREMAKAEERKVKAGRITGGIVGGIAKAILGAVIRGRHH
jgi:hypothetical protein